MPRPKGSKNPVFTKNKMPEIADKLEAWYEDESSLW